MKLTPARQPTINPICHPRKRLTAQNLHPEISCVGEFHWQRVTMPVIDMLNNSIRLPEGGEGKKTRHQIWLRMDQFIKESIVLANRPDAIWVGDRTPSNIQPTIIAGARVFNCIRDGRDVLVSKAYHFYNFPLRYQKFAELPKHQSRLEKFNQDPAYFLNSPDELLDCEDFIRETVSDWVETIEQNKKAIDAHAEMKTMEVRYEDVHRDTEAMRRAMYEFLDVDPELARPLDTKTRPGFEVETPNKFLRKGVVGD